MDLSFDSDVNFSNRGARARRSLRSLVQGRTLQLLATLALAFVPATPLAPSTEAGALPINAGASATTYGYSGNVETYVVPAGVCAIDLVVVGAAGGAGENGRWRGGSGARVTVPGLKVLPGTSITIRVGQGGEQGDNGEDDGGNLPGVSGDNGGDGGATGGNTGGDLNDEDAGGGGAASTVSFNGAYFVIAGGGGGGGGYDGLNEDGRGGDAGALSDGAGERGAGNRGGDGGNTTAGNLPNGPGNGGEGLSGGGPGTASSVTSINGATYPSSVGNGGQGQYGDNSIYTDADGGGGGGGFGGGEGGGAQSGSGSQSGGGGGAGGSFKPPSTDTLSNSTFANAGNGDSNSGDPGSVSITPAYGCEADLQTTKTVNALDRQRGESSTYSIVVNNNSSPGTNQSAQDNPAGVDPQGYTYNGARNIVVVDRYPLGFTPTSVPAGCVTDTGSRTITCTRSANLAAGSSYTLTVTGTWDNSIPVNPDGAIKNNTVNVSHDRYDPNPGNDSDSAVVKIYDNPEMGTMSVTKALSSGSAGSVAGWTFVATSTNPKCTPIAIATTNASGTATFSNIIDVGVDNTPNCTYTITEVQQQGFVQTNPASGGSLTGDPTSAGSNAGTFTNRGASYGDIVVTKSIAGGGDPSGFTFVATNSPAVAGCTSSAVATSGAGGTATFSNLVDVLPNGAACTYVVTEIARAGYTITSGSPSSAVNPNIPAQSAGTVVNTPSTTATGQFTITKSITGAGSVQGWVFVAESNVAGCTDSAVATTNASGVATFEVLEKTSGGVNCTYTVTEIPQAGFSQTSPAGPTTADPTGTAPYPNYGVTNRAATTGTINVTKAVIDQNNAPVATPNIRADWTFVLSATTADPACTQGPVYAVTNAAGATSFNVVATTPGGVTCQYTITEIAQPGYTQTLPAAPVTNAQAGGTVAFTNKEVLQTGSFKVEKEVYNSLGVLDTTLRGGWTFIATGNQPGCTATAVATTDGAGIAEFVNVIKVNASGTACTYTVTEATQAGYAVSGVPATGDPSSATIPKVTNRANATATYGSIVVDKDVFTAAGGALTAATDLEGWAITASSSQSGCTATSVALTDSTGKAVFPGLVMKTADGTECQYTISEQVPAGYTMTVSPATPIKPVDPAPAAAQATVTNTEIQTRGEFSIQKTVQGGNGSAANWVFVASSTQEGCTSTAVETTDGSGLATFDVIDKSYTGQDCVYQVTEVLKDGYVNTVAPPTAANPGAVGSGPTYGVTNVGVTTGTITVDKTVVVDGTSLATGDARNGGWVFTLVNAPATAGCTTGPVYAITGTDGIASFPNVVDKPAGSNTACEYTITEVEQAGYDVTSTNPVTSVSVGDPVVPFENTQNQTLGSLTVQKSVVDGLGQPAPAAREGWTFVASSTQAGCTASATAVTDANGLATFTNLIDVNADGVQCVYEIDEVQIPGYTATGVPASNLNPGDSSTVAVTNTADPIATESSVIVHKNVDPSVGATLVGGTDNDALLGNWVFTLTGTAPCTTGPVYAITNNNGVAVFSNLVDKPAGSNTSCQYTVTEVTQDGYTVSPTASQTTSTGTTPVVFTNTENQKLSGFDVEKIVLDPAGAVDTDAREGWTFIATSATPGCSNPAVAVTGADGLAHFENIVETNADGDPCIYTVTEAQQAGYTTTDVPLTIDPDTTNDPAVIEDTITNQADPVSTYGDIAITKTVNNSDGVELTTAADRSGWIMQATNNPTTPGCTTTATAITDTNGVAWFTGLIKTTANGDDCTYVITEAPEPGYTVGGSPTAAIAPVDPLTNPTRADGQANITNTEQIAYGTITANKTLIDEYGNTVPAGDPRLTGWTFVAIAETPGCTTTATQTTNNNGEVEFTNLIATNTNGDTCTYTIDEIRGPGYTVTGAPYTSITPGNPATNAGTITNTLTPKATTGNITINKTVNLQDGTTWDINNNGTPASGWVFTLTSSTAGCTPGPVYAITDETGTATFTGVIDKPAGSTTPCQYVVTEITQPGFTPSTNPVSGVSTGQTASFTNDERTRIGQVKVQKTVVDELGNTITTGDPVAGWTFTATSTGDGCTDTSVTTSGTDGTATFANLVSINPDGDQCQYTISEVEIPGWTTAGLPQTAVIPDATNPPLLAVTNTADAATTPGEITITKTVVQTGGPTLNPGTANPLLSGWVFSIQAASGQPADCTQGPVYGVTTDTGQATVTGLVDKSATAGRPTCVYTVTEITRPGYVASPASQDVPAGGTAAFTNTEVRTFTTLTVNKSALGPDGQPDNASLAGWSFVAASAQDGCTSTAVATSDGSGVATFTNLVDIAPSGVECTYLVTEMGQSGWTQTSASPGPVNPPATVGFTNQADPISTFGVASVQKAVRTADGIAVPGALAGWAMTAVSVQPGCTPSAVSLTDANGLAVFSGLVDVTAAGTQCVYTITEIPAAGYDVSGSPVLNVDATATLGAPAATITNTEIQTMGSLSVQKTVIDPFGQPVADASGWTFLATSAMSGCTTAAAGVTSASGALVIGPLVDISSTGTECVYTLIEVTQAGFTTADVPVTGTLSAIGQPVRVTNRAGAVAVDGLITVQKTVLDPDGNAVPGALADWVFVANAEVAGCTPSAFGMTNASGVATLDVLDSLADGTACTYTISEVGADGYLTQITPSTGVAAGQTVAATNQEISVPAATIEIVKEGADADVPLGGWVFVATTSVSGCPSNRTTVTNAQGRAEFFELPTESPDGVACEYTIVEISQAGFEATSPASGSYTVTPTDGDSLKFVNASVDSGVDADMSLGCGFATQGSNVVEPGDQVAIYAPGYQPGTVMIVEANGIVLGTFTVPADGVVTGLVTIPDLPPGSYQLIATGTEGPGSPKTSRINADDKARTPGSRTKLTQSGSAKTDAARSTSKVLKTIGIAKAVGGARILTCPFIAIPASSSVTTSPTGGGTTGGTTDGSTATTNPAGGTTTGGGTATTTPGSGVGGAGTATTIPSGLAGTGSSLDPAVAAAINAANAAITAAQTRGTAGDSDGDGVLDTIETKLGFDPNDPNSKPAADLDTDGDGFPDVVEAMLGYDWKDPNDPLNRGRFGGDSSTSRSARVAGATLDRDDSSSIPQRMARTGADHLPFLLSLGGGLILVGMVINRRARRREPNNR